MADGLDKFYGDGPKGGDDVLLGQPGFHSVDLCSQDHFQARPAMLEASSLAQQYIQD